MNQPTVNFVHVQTTKNFPSKTEIESYPADRNKLLWTDQCQPYSRYLLVTHLFPSFTASGSGVMPPLCCPVKYHPIPVIARSGRITWTHVSTYNINNDVIQCNKDGRLPGSDFCSFCNSCFTTILCLVVTRYLTLGKEAFFSVYFSTQQNFYI